jgi:hypothetical protein
MAKDEGPRLLEWLAYHRLRGFDAIWVYSNDCRDGTDAMLDRLAQMGLVTHRRNAVPPDRKPQPQALRLAEREAALRRADWLMVLDIDEFLHVKVGDGGVGALLAACPPGTEGIAVPWRVFGSAGRGDWSDAPILTQFDRAAPEAFRRGWGVKTLFRPFEGMRRGIHRPTLRGAGADPAQAARLERLRWVNGSGRPLPPSFLRDGWRASAATVGYDLAEVAHFAVQSREAYLLRGDRGNVNRKPDKYDAAHFAIFDRNEVPAPGLAGASGEVQAMVADWRRDAVLDRLHRAAVDWHRDRLSALLRGAEARAFLHALEAAGQVPFEALDRMLYPQPLPPEGKRQVAALRAQGLPDDKIAAMVARSVAAREAERDAREATEIAAMGPDPWGLGRAASEGRQRPEER